MTPNVLSPCVVLEILDFIRYDETRSPAEQARDLGSTSLISKHWSQASQHLLFRNVHLVTEKQYRAFLRIASSNLKLSASVRQLKITIDGDTTDGTLTEGHLFPLLEACPRLYELDLTYNVPTFSPNTVAQLRRLSCRPVALRCATGLTWEGTPVPTEVAYQLALVWHNSLEFLILGGEPFCLLGPPPVAPFSAKLKEFRWTGFDRPADEVLDWFLNGARSSLRYLFLDSLPPTAEAFDHLMQIHGPSLRSLHIRDLFGVRPESLRHCVRLEEFGLDRGMDEVVLEILAGADHASRITHLEFGVKVKAQTSQLLESAASRIITGGGLPRLTTVTIKQWGGTWNLEATVMRWRGILVGVDVLNGSPMKRTASQRKNLPVSKITNLFDSKSFPRTAGPIVYRFMSTKRDTAIA